MFTNPAGQPLSQERLHDRVWTSTLVRAGIPRRGQYCIRDTFITLALSSGEDPGWVAQVCGTSEEMIFRHYRRWIPGLRPGAGERISAILRSVDPRPSRSASLKPSPDTAEKEDRSEISGEMLAERGDSNPRDPFESTRVPGVRVKPNSATSPRRAVSMPFQPSRSPEAKDCRAGDQIRRSPRYRRIAERAMQSCVRDIAADLTEPYLEQGTWGSEREPRAQCSG